MIIYEFKYPAQNPPDLLNVCTQDCPPPIDPCNNIYEALTVECNAGPAQGHTCNDALFDAYILDFPATTEKGKNVWIYLQRTNFNNAAGSGQSGQVYHTIKISKEIVEQANRTKDEREECCNLNLTLIAAPFPTALTLPYEADNEIYMPPIGSDAYTVGPRQRARVHNNIVSTKVMRDSDGLVLSPTFIWQGVTPIDLCIGLEGPGAARPDNPIFPVDKPGWKYYPPAAGLTDGGPPGVPPGVPSSPPPPPPPPPPPR
jgi:hypothetical protein